MTITMRDAWTIIEQTDARTVGETYRTDERAITLLKAMSDYLTACGVTFTKDGTSVIVELMRSTYYLGYERGHMIAAMPTFTVAENEDDQL